MSRKSGSAWRAQQSQDPYFQLAKKRGLRSRAGLKLEEIDQQENLLFPGAVVVDLGAAPGSWSQIAAQRVNRAGKIGKVIALDILPILPLADVVILKGDILQPTIQAALHAQLSGKSLDLVISDMAPNTSGIRFVDQTKSMQLAEMGLHFCQQSLKTGGHYLVKVFEGPDVPGFRKALAECFHQVKTLKPKASRSDSIECYLLAKGFNAKLIEADKRTSGRHVDSNDVIESSGLIESNAVVESHDAPLGST
jgi:23S rRNA (uridine2552-2'-O)-methyltransferase